MVIIVNSFIYLLRQRDQRKGSGWECLDSNSSIHARMSGGNSQTETGSGNGFRFWTPSLEEPRPRWDLWQISWLDQAERRLNCAEPWSSFHRPSRPSIHVTYLKTGRAETKNRFLSPFPVYWIILRCLRMTNLLLCKLFMNHHCPCNEVVNGTLSVVKKDDNDFAPNPYLLKDID